MCYLKALFGVGQKSRSHGLDKLSLDNLLVSIGCSLQGINERNIFNPLPNDKILDWSKLKPIADNILKCI